MSKLPAQTFDALRAQFADGRPAGQCLVPAEALRFDAGPFALADGEGKEGKHPVKMRARSGQPIVHWYWGKIVHDMAGFKAAKPTIPIDYCHYSDEVLGFLNEFKTSNAGLDVAGELVKFREDDRSAEVIHKAKAGVPYEASIFFDPNSLSIEEVGPNAEVEVNGFKLQGPAVIVRKWSVRGVAICPYGADGKTQTKFAADQAGESVQFVTPHQEPDAMGQPATIPAPANPAPAPAASTPSALSAPSAVPSAAPPNPAAPADQAAAFRAELKRFTEKFGAENGTKWFTEGKTFEQALELHVAEVNTKLTAKDAEIAALNAKLAVIPRGEAEPVSMSTDETHPAGSAQPAGKFAHMGNLGKFAQNLKLPSSKAS